MNLYSFSLPSSGVNKSDVPDYPRVPDECAFFNNKFLIFSSLGSFFIPCIIIFAIYYRIFMVIIARAKQNRKQWRPKAAIESAAAQHRTNANHLVTSFLHERNDLQNNNNNNNDNDNTNNNNTDHHDNLLQSTALLSTKPSVNTHESVQLKTNPERNVLMLQLTTPALLPTVRASINVTSSSGDQLDDDERDDIALFVHQEQEDNHRNHTKELSRTVNRATNCQLDESATFQMTTRSSQTEDPKHAHNSVKHFKTRLKAKPSSDGLPTTTTNPTQAKSAKRKAYSRMKKERKATQTLIIVLSMSSTVVFFLITPLSLHKYLTRAD